MRRMITASFVALLATAGCEADREVFEEGATLEAPAEVEAAPEYPIPPQPIPRTDTPDTAILDTLGQQGSGQ